MSPCGCKSYTHARADVEYAGVIVTEPSHRSHLLCRNGFARLRQGGTLVYSTCSLTVAQNEGVVSAFLESEPSARVVPITRFGDGGSTIAAGASGATASAGAAVALSAAAGASDGGASASPTAALPVPPSGAGSALPRRDGALRDYFASLHRGAPDAAARPPPPCIAGGAAGTVRFEPAVSGCGGLFIARLTKLPAAP